MEVNKKYDSKLNLKYVKRRILNMKIEEKQINKSRNVIKKQIRKEEEITLVALTPISE